MIKDYDDFKKNWKGLSEAQKLELIDLIQEETDLEKNIEKEE